VTGKILDANPFIEKLLGYSRQNLSVSNSGRLVCFAILRRIKPLFGTTERGYIRYDHLPLETKGGQMAEVEFVSNVYQVDSIRKLFNEHSDITESSRLEPAAFEQAEALAEPAPPQGRVSGHALA